MVSTIDTMSEITLAAGADESYALPLAVTLHSALTHIDPAVRVRMLVLDGGMTADSRERVERVIADTHRNTVVDWPTTDRTALSGVKTTPTGSESNYLRLFVPELAEDVSHVIYLDSDLVVQGDLTQLLKTGLRSPDSALVAVRDYLHLTVGHAFGEAACDSIGVDPDSPYFNSGVLVINTAAWRELRVRERAIEVAQQHRDLLPYSDQDALNVVLGGDWLRADDSWNVMLSTLQHYVSGPTDTRSDWMHNTHEVRSAARVLHFNGDSKPWMPGYTGVEGRRFRRNLYRSGWFRSTREKLAWRTWYWADPRWLGPIKIRLARRFPRQYEMFVRLRSWR